MALNQVSVEYTKRITRLRARSCAEVILNLIRSTSKQEKRFELQFPRRNNFHTQTVLRPLHT